MAKLNEFIDEVGEDFISDIKECLYEGFMLHKESLDILDAHLDLKASDDYSIYCKNVIHNIFESLKKRFGGRNDVKFHTINQKPVMRIGKFAISINKLRPDKSKAPNNTDSDENYRSGELFSEDKLVPLYAGYVLDKNNQNITSTYIVLQSGSNNFIHLESFATQEQLTFVDHLDKPNQQVSTTQKVELKIKKSQNKEIKQ